MLPSSPPSPLLLSLLPPKKTNQKAEVEKNASKFQLAFNCDDDSRIHWRRIRINRYTAYGYGYSNWYSFGFFADCLPYWLRLKRSDLQHSLRFFRFIIIFIYYYCVYYWIRIRFQFRFQFRWFFQGACHKNWKLVVVATSIFNLGGLSKFIYFWRRVQQFNCGCATWRGRGTERQREGGRRKR